MIDNKWLEKFYTECGREVSLAYNVLNHTNTWGVTILSGLLSIGFIGASKFENNTISLIYPTFIHWYYIIFIWIIMLRLFARSALALCNMYRWNELIYATSKVLLTPKEDEAFFAYHKNCALKIDAYFFRWKSPKTIGYLAWANLKLMYFWIFLVLLLLLLWGLFLLEQNILFYIGITIFVASTLLEAIWFIKYHGLQYEKLELLCEKNIKEILESNSDVK